MEEVLLGGLGSNEGFSPGCRRLTNTLFSSLSSLELKEMQRRRKEGRTGEKKVELLSGLLSTLWFASGLSLLACSLMVSDGVEGMDGRLFIRRRLAAGALETFEIHRRHCSRSDGRRRGDRHSMPPEKKLRDEREAGCCRRLD